MSENPYQTPEAELEIKANEDKSQFYVVSIFKFTILFFSTLGLYVIYWFYQNWKEYKTFSGRNIWPVPRAIFNIFFTHSLFKEVQKSLDESGKTFNWSPGMLATAYVIVAIVSNVLDRMSMREIGSPYSDILSLLILPLMYFTLVKPQKAINFSQNDPEGTTNSQFTAANYVWIVIGLIFWALALFGFVLMFGYVDPE